MLPRATFTLLLALVMTLTSVPSGAQGSQKGNIFSDIAQFDKTVHDFGDIMVSDGPVSASFNVKNVSDKPMVIYNVVTSCGCTNVEWTRQPVKSGESGEIKAVYKNDEGGYPFDKTLTAYISGIKQPIVLRLKGESHAKKVSLSEMYPVRFGNIGFKNYDIKCGNLSQGQQKSGEVTIANLGSKPVNVSFGNVSDGLALKVYPNPIPAGQTAKLSYTVTADRSRWGKNYYYAEPLADGRSNKAAVSSSFNPHPDAGAESIIADPDPEIGAGKNKIGVFAITKENFSSWTKEQKDKGSQPMAGESTFTFGKVKAGTKVKASFTITNQGKSPLKIYKVDSETSHAVVAPFADLAAGAKRDLNVTLDTSALPKGETLIVLTVITNSPLRPIMNLFLAGWVE